MRMALAGVVLIGGCARPVAREPEVFPTVQPYRDARVLVHLGGPVAVPEGVQPVRVPLGPPGTDRCDQPESRTVVDVADEGAAVTVTLLARGATCVVEASDVVAIEYGGWERGVMVPAGACRDAEWALPGAHPRAALVVTETTRFYAKPEAAALPADEGARLLRTADSAATLVLSDEALPFLVYELWHNGMQDGVRIRRDGVLVRELPERPRAYVVEAGEVGAILRRDDGFRTAKL